MNRSVIQISMVLMMLAVCVAVTQSQTFEWELVEGRNDWMATANAVVAAEDGGMIEIVAELGGITVEGEDIDEARIEVRFGVSDRYEEEEVREWMEGLNPTIEVSGNRIEVNVDDFSSRHSPNNWNLSIVAVVPINFNVEAETALGGLEATHLNGSVDFETATGGIDVEHVTGEITLSTATGHISLLDVEGRIWGHTDTGGLELEDIRATERCRITTSTGGIDIMDTRGQIIVETGTGGIEIDGYHEQLRAETGTGSVDVRAESGDIECSTGTGRLKVTLEEDAEITHMDLFTGSGSIDVRVDPSLSLVVDAIIHDNDDDNDIYSDFTMEVIRERHDVHGRVTLNDGGPLIEVVTEDGNISIEER